MPTFVPGSADVVFKSASDVRPFVDSIFNHFALRHNLTIKSTVVDHLMGNADSFFATHSVQIDVTELAIHLSEILEAVLRRKNYQTSSAASTLVEADFAGFICNYLWFC